MTTRAELNELTFVGEPLARGAFINIFMMNQRVAFGHGKFAGEIAPTRRAVFEASLAAVKADFPALHVLAPPGWLDE